MAFVFDEPENLDLEIGESLHNKKVQVTDTQANYISDRLYEFFSRRDIMQMNATELVFEGMKKNHFEEYDELVKSRVKNGRFKSDFFVPFPSCHRMDKHDVLYDLRSGGEFARKLFRALDDPSNDLFIDDLDGSLLEFPKSLERETPVRGSAELGTIKHKYEKYAEFMSTYDDVTCNVNYLFENYSNGNTLFEHEKFCIDSYRPVVEEISKTRLASYSKFLKSLSDSILMESRYIKTGRLRVSTHGDSRIISIRNRSNLSSNESGPLVCFLVRMSSADLEVYNHYKDYRTLFVNEQGEEYKFIPWRAFSLIDCVCMQKFEYNLYTFPLLLLDYKSENLKDSVYKINLLLSGLLQCRVSEVFDVISNFRYILPGSLNPLNNIGSLILDKFPKEIRSPFTDYMIWGVFDWLNRFRPTLRIHDRARKVIIAEAMEDFDVEFQCLLPYVGIVSHNFQQFLTMIYLSSMSQGKTKLDRHVNLKLAKTLQEWEEKYQSSPSEFDYDEDILEELCFALEECTQTQPLPLDSTLARYLRTKGTLNDTNRLVFKLYDRVLDEIRYPIHAQTIKDYLEHNELCPEMRMAVRDDHSGEREIFVTSLPAVVGLNMIETSAHSVCEQLQSEHITLGGERKFKIMQAEAQAAHQSTVNGWHNILGSEDASKWSTGDNPMILKKIAESTLRNEPKSIKDKLTTFIESMLDRKVFYSTRTEDYLNSKLDKDCLNLHMGWPQGFFNKLSSLKHYLCYCLAISAFKRNYDGSSIVRIKFAVHSDDSRYRLSVEKKESVQYAHELFLKCLYWAKSKLLIRPNKRKSFYGGIISEYLSNFQFHGSLFVPISKFALTIFGDLSGNGYAADTYSIMERVREVMRLNGGMMLGCYLMKQANHYVRRLYSLLPGMKGYNEKYNNSDNLIEFGGVFTTHPIFLMFIGCKAHDVLGYKRNYKQICKLVGFYKDEPDESEHSPQFLYSHFLPIPSTTHKSQGNIKYVRKRYNDAYLDKSEQWKILYLQDLKTEDIYNVAGSLLFTDSMAKAYSTSPEGLLYARIKQNCLRANYRWKDEFFTFSKLIEKIESWEPDTNAPKLIEDLLRSSPTLAALRALSSIEDIDCDPPERNNVASSQVNSINILNPGSLQYRYMKYAFAQALDLKIVIPDFVDERILEDETERMSSELDQIPAELESENIMHIYKYLGIRHSSPKFLHLNKHLTNLDSIDMYELVSLVLSSVSHSLLSRVRLGKLSSVKVGQRVFRPEDVSFRRDRLDEVKSAARLTSLYESIGFDLERVKKEMYIAGQTMSALLDYHPLPSNDPLYYIDYLYLCDKLKISSREDKIKVKGIDINGNKLISVGRSVSYIRGNEIIIHDEYDTMDNLKKLIGAAYLMIDQFRMEKNWSDTCCPPHFIDVAPHLYYKYFKDNRSEPTLIYDRGTLRFCTGYHNKYLEGIKFAKLDLDDVEKAIYDSEVSELYNFDPAIFEASMYGDKTCGIAYKWMGSVVSLIGESAKFKAISKFPECDFKGFSFTKLVKSGYFVTDELIHFSSGIRIYDPSKLKRKFPEINPENLNKTDFDSLKDFWYYLADSGRRKRGDRVAGLSQFTEIKERSDLYDLCYSMPYYSSEISMILTPRAAIAISKLLYPIRCKFKHTRVLEIIKGKLLTQFDPGVDDMRPTKSNLAELLLKCCAMIGINQEVSEPQVGELTSTDLVEFSMYIAYSGCSGQVWAKIFNDYLDTDDELID